MLEAHLKQRKKNRWAELASSMQHISTADPQWFEIILYPSALLITGKRGSGKSALGYWLLENLSWHYRIPAYVFGLPPEKRHLLGNHIGTVYDLSRLPEEAITLFDEAHLSFYARAHYEKDSNQLMDMLITISRQKNQILIFATQETRKLEKNVVAGVDCVICKEPSIFQQEFERPQMKKITKEAKQAFDMIDDNEKEKYAYIYSENFRGVLTNAMPTFWSDQLSRAFAGIPLEIG